MPAEVVELIFHSFFVVKTSDYLVFAVQHLLGAQQFDAS